MAEGMDVVSDEKYRVSLVLLADELIDIILSYRFLNYRDLCRFAQVCVRFNNIGCYSEIWRKKAMVRWKKWKKPPDDHWKEIFKKRLKTQIEIEKILEKLGQDCGSKADVSYKQYKEVDYLENDVDYAGYLNCTLEEYVFGDPRLTNLTYKYYAERLYIHFRRSSLKKEWKAFMSKPLEEQHLEDGALIVAKWLDYKIDDEMTSLVKSGLDSLADRVRRIVGDDEPSDSDQQDYPYYITDPKRCSKIIDGIKQVMFVEDNFCGNTQDYYNVKNSFITEVMKSKQGIPISLSVVFIAVARRLRVEIEPVNTPRHFMVRWCSNPESGTMRHTYIDVYDGGKPYNEEHYILQFLSGLINPLPAGETSFDVASPRDVSIRMASNILNILQTPSRMDNGLRSFRDSLELLTFIKPEDGQNKVLLARVHLHLGINLDECIETLQEQSWLNNRAAAMFLDGSQEQKERHERMENQPLVPMLRSDPKHKEITFKVGMVMRHKRYHYGCVIYGWDSFCDMDESWILQMGVDRLPNGRNQPFYNVLGDDGSSRYAAQENLKEEPDQPFNPHQDLGRYFERWNGTRYMPNHYLRQRYPEDEYTDE